MAGVKDDQTHSFENSFLNPLDDPVLHLIVREMTPPDDYVGFIEA
jgi:hypothetical protein